MRITLYGAVACRCVHACFISDTAHDASTQALLLLLVQQGLLLHAVARSTRKSALVMRLLQLSVADALSVRAQV